MWAIWKYRMPDPRRDGEPSFIEMPEGAVVLTLQDQFQWPTIWVLVDPEAPKKPRGFRVLGTGWEMPGDPGRYVGTSQRDHGLLVWHLFEVTP